MSTIIYLHGFRSGPISNKGIFFRKKLKNYRIDLVAPDLNLPTFSKLSVSNMVEEISSTCRRFEDEDIVIIASSLGTLPLLRFINNRPKETAHIKKIILLAPTFNFLRTYLFKNEFEPVVEKWKQQGFINIFQTYYNNEKPLQYAFLEDVRKYAVDEVNNDIPILIIHGKKDEVVDYRDSISFSVKNERSVKLCLIEDGDHRLTNHLEKIWEICEDFLGDFLATKLVPKLEILNLDTEQGLHVFKKFESTIMEVFSKAYNDEYLGNDFHKRRILTKSGKLFVASIDEEICGALYIQPDGKVTSLGILPHFQNRGVAKYLIESSFHHFDYQYCEVKGGRIKDVMISAGFKPVTSMQNIIKNLEGKEEFISELRRIDGRIYYIRRNPSVKNYYYEVEMLERTK